jgi:hypothetical protein
VPYVVFSNATAKESPDVRTCDIPHSIENQLLSILLNHAQRHTSLAGIKGKKAA